MLATIHDDVYAGFLGSACPTCNPHPKFFILGVDYKDVFLGECDLTLKDPQETAQHFLGHDT